MKLSKVFGIVLSLHVGVILLVMFQPSCQTTGGKANVPTDEHTDNADESFNQAIEGIDEPLIDDATPGMKNQMSLPYRKDLPLVNLLFLKNLQQIHLLLV